MLIPQNAWNRYKNIINEFHNSANQDDLQWYSQPSGIPVAGEEVEGEPKLNATLKVLFYYNYFRTWPITDYTIQGEVDKESSVALININYLKSLNLADANGRLIYDEAKDFFVHRGEKFEASGDSFLAQAHGEPLLYMIILKRLEHVR